MGEKHLAAAHHRVSLTRQARVLGGEACHAVLTNSERGPVFDCAIIGASLAIAHLLGRAIDLRLRSAYLVCHPLPAAGYPPPSTCPPGGAWGS